MTDVTEQSSNALSAAVENGKAVLDNSDASVLEISNAIEEIENAIKALEYKKLVVDDGASLVVDRETDTEYTYMVGLNPKANTVADIEAQLKNSGVQIVVTKDGKTLSSEDRVGTGSVIKCVSSADPSVVYEVATVILYGDVNGDGIVDENDMSLLLDDAFDGAENIEENSVYYIAADLSKDGVLDVFDYFYLDGIASGNRSFDQTQTLYK